MARERDICGVCKAPQEKRQPLTVLVTTCEMDAIKKAAKNDGNSFAGWARGMLVMLADEEVSASDFYKALPRNKCTHKNKRKS